MPPKFNAVTSGQGNAAAKNLTHSASGGHRYALATLATRFTVGSPSVTYDGVAMTVIAILQPFGGEGELSIWQMINPPIGSKTIAFSWTVARTFVAAIETFNLVDQQTPRGGLANGTGNSGGPTVNVGSTPSDSLVIDAAGSQRPFVSVGGGQTQRWNQSHASTPSGAGSTEPGNGGTVTMSWGTSLAGPWRVMAFALNFGPVGGGQVIIMMSKMRDFYRDLKRGIIRPDELQKRYGELVQI